MTSLPRLRLGRDAAAARSSPRPTYAYVYNFLTAALIALQEGHRSNPQREQEKNKAPSFLPQASQKRSASRRGRSLCLW